MSTSGHSGQQSLSIIDRRALLCDTQIVGGLDCCTIRHHCWFLKPTRAREAAPSAKNRRNFSAARPMKQVSDAGQAATHFWSSDSKNFSTRRTRRGDEVHTSTRSNCWFPLIPRTGALPTRAPTSFKASLGEMIYAAPKRSPVSSSIGLKRS